MPTMCSWSILWEHWCCGNSVKRISALRKIRSTDVTFVKRGRHTLNDIKHLMGLIEKEAIRKQLHKQQYTRVEAKKVYEECKSAVLIPRTNLGSKQNRATLKWSKILKSLPESQKINLHNLIFILVDNIIALLLIVLCRLII